MSSIIDDLITIDKAKQKKLKHCLSLLKGKLVKNINEGENIKKDISILENYLIN